MRLSSCVRFSFMLRLSITRTTAANMSVIPTASLNVKSSPNTIAPMHTAVTGSSAPRIEVSVPPMLRTASSSVMFYITVGATASNTTLTVDTASGKGCTPSPRPFFTANISVVNTKT